MHCYPPVFELRYGMVWYGIWYGMVWYGMVWHMVWYGMVWYGSDGVHLDEAQRSTDSSAHNPPLFELGTTVFIWTRHNAAPTYESGGLTP